MSWPQTGCNTVTHRRRDEVSRRAKRAPWQGTLAGEVPLNLCPTPSLRGTPGRLSGVSLCLAIRPESGLFAGTLSGAHYSGCTPSRSVSGREFDRSLTNPERRPGEKNVCRRPAALMGGGPLRKASGPDPATRCPGRSLLTRSHADSGAVRARPSSVRRCSSRQCRSHPQCSPSGGMNMTRAPEIVVTVSLTDTVVPV